MEPSMEKILAGDPTALQSLFSKKGYSVYKFAADRTDDREIAKRVTKEVFSGLPLLLKKRNIESLTPDSLDRILIERTKELCDSFQDLAAIRGELFGEKASGSAEEMPTDTKENASPSPSFSSYRVEEKESSSPSTQEAAAIPENTSPIPSAEPYTKSSSPSSEPTLLTGLISPVVVAKDPKPAFEDVSSKKETQASPPLYQVPASNRKALSSLYDDPGFPEEPEEDTFYEKDAGEKYVLFGFLLFLLIVCIMILGWAIVGILMDIGWIPYMDLGYSWFNETIYPLF